MVLSKICIDLPWHNGWVPYYYQFFCPVILLIVDWGVMKFPTIMSRFPFIFSGLTILSHIFSNSVVCCTLIYDCCVSWANWQIYYYKMSLFVFGNCLCSRFLNINIALPAFFWFMFSYFFFLPFTFNLTISLSLKWVSFKQYIVHHGFFHSFFQSLSFKWLL